MKALRWFLCGLLAGSLPGCFLFDSNFEDKSCITADDCSAPYLCCHSGIAVQAAGFNGMGVCTIPNDYNDITESLDFCDAFRPHLVEGNPCGRVMDPKDPRPGISECREGLECCSTTLTCETKKNCPDTSDNRGKSSGDACHADDDCGTREICCGIDYLTRDGTCTHIDECGGSTGVDEPDPNDEVIHDLCRSARCDDQPEDGAWLDACRAAFAPVADGVSVQIPAACTQAVAALMPLCPYLHGWADTVPNADELPPFLPQSCGFAGGFPRRVDPACDAVLACGLINANAAGWCRAELAAIPKSVIEKITSVTDCDFDLDALGLEPIPTGAACDNPIPDCCEVPTPGCETERGCGLADGVAVCSE